jgi:hypothetical protein
MHTIFWSENLNEENLKDVGMEGKIVVQHILEKWGLKLWIVFVWLGITMMWLFVKKFW